MTVFLTVLLTILKIILIIVLVALGLVFLVLFIVLVPALRYKVAGSSYEEAEFSAKASYLCVSVNAGYTKADGLKYNVKIFGFTLMSNDEEFLEKKKVKKDKIEEKKEQKRLKKLEKEKQKAEKSKKEPVEENIKDDIKENIKENKEESKTESYDEFADFDDTDSDSNDEKKEVVIKESASGEKSKSNKKSEKKSDEKSDKESDKKDSDDSEDSDENKSLSEKIEDIMTKLDHIDKFLGKPYVKKTIARLKKALIKIGKHLKPTKAKGYVHYGLSNSADTGIVSGYASMLYPRYYKWLKLEPDFYNKVVEGELMIKGRIRLGALLVPLLGVALNRSFFRTIKLAKKI